MRMTAPLLACFPKVMLQNLETVAVAATPLHLMKPAEPEGEHFAVAGVYGLDFGARCLSGDVDLCRVELCACDHLAAWNADEAW